MKHLFLLLFCGALFATPVFAQSSFSSWFAQGDVCGFGVATGKTPLTSGADAFARFCDGDLNVFVQGNDVRAFALLGRRFGSFNAAFHLGHFDNAPVLGVQAMYSPIASVTFQTWTGITMGQPGHPDWDPNFYFSYNSVGLSWRGLNLHGAVSFLEFIRDEPIDFVGALGYDYRIAEVWRIRPSVTVTHHSRESLWGLAIIKIFS